MQLIQNILSFNQILTVSLLGWLVAQVLKTIINFILLGKFQLERMWGDGGMPSAHSATVCAMVIATGRCVGVDSAIFAVASVVAIITMHDAMGVRHETGEQAKVLNQMIDQWIEVSEKNAPFLQNMHLKEMVGHTPLQVMAGVLVAQPSASCIRWLETFFFHAGTHCSNRKSSFEGRVIYGSIAAGQHQSAQRFKATE